MKVVLAHNFYQHPGGEDRVYAQEVKLLVSRGHDVVTYQRTNSETAGISVLEKLGLPRKMLWASDSYRHMQQMLRAERPDVVHVHNTFFQISPAIFSACQELGVPVVQTLHNFRLMCPGATYFRAGQICEKCNESSLWQSIRHGCYRQSRGATTAVALMLATHRRKRTWVDKVTLHIALTQFSRSKFAEGGLPPEKIVVKPNFVAPDPGEKTETGEGAVFVGRFSPEKGIPTMLRAWGKLGKKVPLTVIGDGPIAGDLRAIAGKLGISTITFTGQLANDKSQSAIKKARVLILPSQNYENFPVTIVEAMACGTPVICSRLGAMQEIVADRITGLHFTPGDADDLAAKVEWAWDHPGEIKAMGRAARREYELKYTADSNYNSLMSIYQQAIAATH